jgi:hypothetical protein
MGHSGRLSVVFLHCQHMVRGLLFVTCTAYQALVTGETSFIVRVGLLASLFLSTIMNCLNAFNNRLVSTRLS